MFALTVLYDPECGLCRRSHEWLAEQSKLVDLTFVPCASEEARKRFPQLNHDLTKADLTVIGDDGAVYFGPKAWLMVLWHSLVIASGRTGSPVPNCCRPRNAWSRQSQLTGTRSAE